MYVRRVKRKCSVKGCKNTECFSISRTREAGNTVIACKDCLEQTVKAIDEIDPNAKNNIPVLDNTLAPPLFFNEKAFAAADKLSDNAETAENSDTDDTDVLDELTSQSENSEFICPDCGKKFDSEKGLKSHKRHCKQADEE